MIWLASRLRGFNLRRANLRWHRDPLRDGYLLAACLWCLAIGLGVIDGASDGREYYRYRLPDPYEWTDYSVHGFFYTPPIAFAVYPLTLLPWTWFAATWTGLMFAGLYGLAGRWSFLALLFPPVWWELQAANVNILIGLAAVTGLRWAPAWAFVFLTKITPGIAIAWFAFRREWRMLGIAIAVTLAIVAVSFAITPGLWYEWWASLTKNVGNNGPGYFVVPLTLPVRLLLALIVVGWGALTDRRWTVPVAVCLGMPVLWFNALAPLVAIPFLVDRPKRLVAPAFGLRGSLRLALRSLGRRGTPNPRKGPDAGEAQIAP